jgi:hypothetical protein
MPGKPKSRNWNDVQTAIATVAIVTTLGMWNLFASPSRAVKTAETSEPVQPPPPTELPVENQVAPIAITPTSMPQVKIMFTPGVTPVVQQQVQQVQQPVKKKKKNNNNGSSTTSSGTTSVTQTKSS